MIDCSMEIDNDEKLKYEKSTPMLISVPKWLAKYVIKKNRLILTNKIVFSS